MKEKLLDWIVRISEEPHKKLFNDTLWKVKRTHSVAIGRPWFYVPLDSDVTIWIQRIVRHCAHDNSQVNSRTEKLLNNA